MHSIRGSATLLDRNIVRRGGGPEPMPSMNRPSSSASLVESRYVNIEHGRAHYLSWGRSGPVVVLVHATGFHALVWKPIALALSYDSRVIAVDQRGHGDSPKPATGYSWEVFGQDLSTFLKALDLSGVVAVGHSAGATAIALSAAADPQLFQRIILIDPVLYPRAGTEQGSPLAQRARKRRMVWESRTAMFNSYKARDPFRTWREDVLWAYIEEGTTLQPDGQVTLKCPAEIEAQVYEMAPRLDGFSVLAQLALPVLLIRGEHSDTFSEGAAEKAMSILNQGKLKTIAATTHFVPMERPEAVERAIRKFMAR